MRKIICLCLLLSLSLLPVMVRGGVADGFPGEKNGEDSLRMVPVAANYRIVKMNSLLAIGFVNPAFEFALSEKYSLQLESLGIFYPRGFWGTDGRPVTVVAGWVEGRRYFRNPGRGFYLGLNAGFAYYRTSKDKGYWDNHILHFGAAIMLGASAGYKVQINDRWSIDISYGNGWNASNYEGWNNETGERNVHLNWSHDFLPAYKGGIFICYTF